MKKYLARLVEFTLDHAVWFVVVFAAITALAATVLPNAVMASAMTSMFFDDEHQEFSRFQQRAEQFGNNEVIVFGVECEEPMSAENARRLEELHGRLEAFEFVGRVTSLGDFERVGLRGDTIEVRDFTEEAQRHPERSKQLARELHEDPVANGLLVAEDAGHFLVVVALTFDAGRSAESFPKLISTMVEEFEDVGYERDAIHLGGMPVTMGELIYQSKYNITRLFPLVILFLLVSVYLMFGRFWPVFVTTISALLAVTWTMAFAIWREPMVNVLMTVLPTLVMIISFSDVVHLCSVYLLQIDAGTEKREAIVRATSEVGAACLLTSVTTGVGIFSISFIPAPAFRQLGVVGAVGVLLAYGLAMTLVPIILHWMPEPRPWRAGRRGSIQRGVDVVLRRIDEFARLRAWPIIVAFAVLIVVAVYGSLQIEFETVFTQRLDEDNPVRVDETFLKEHFASPLMIDLYVETDEQEAALEPGLFNDVVALEEEIEAMEGVDKVVSLADLMRATHRTLVDDPKERPFTPLSGPAIAQMMVMLEMQGVDSLQPFIDFSHQTLKLTVYASDKGIVSQDALRDRVESLARARLGDRARVEGLGIGPLLGAWVSNILAGQRRGLLFSLCMIAFILIIGFRSVRMGLWSMIPNVLPLLAVGAFGGFVLQEVDTDTLIVAMIALGIGVDDTIHFIARYRAEAMETHDRGEAVSRTFNFAGRGIMITTFIFVVGFIPLVLSDYYSIHIMGALLPFCFVIALLADLLLVPAMIHVGALRTHDG